jgi:enterochelin esterase family protein
MDTLETFTIASPSAGEPRTAWVQRLTTGPADNCLIFLDAELYIQRVRAPQILNDLFATGRLPPTNVVYLSSVSPAARHADYTCNERFSSFLATDLQHWIERNFAPHAKYAICGLSLSGLAAAFAVLRHPGDFDRAICQSPSAWWNDEWLSASLIEHTSRAGRIWLSVGDQELESGVSHAPTGLFQGTCQLDSCRRLAASLTGRCAALHFSEYSGGHDPACWAEELPHAIDWLLGSRAK